jgi:chromosome segregation protein
LRGYDNQLKDRREKLNKLQNKLNSVRIDLEKVRMAIEGIREQAAEKYHIEIAEYEFEFDPEFKAETVGRRVSRLRKQIEDMGAINMMAIEEYEQLTERKEFIEAQREEVFSSIAILEEAIEEMEETSKNKFMEIYATINLEFGNLFPILFPGGEARLELSEPDDPLNSGVEIMCRLPGKSHQRMNLFSGGEKALTAISLIFALLKTKPTPFCFLDEVDAPLDEANVGRYNKVLEALSERFQFIVITHNRRTMEVLDTLYGVTMQEPGVSKVVGVDLKKDLPDHLKKAFKETKKKESEDDRPVAGASSSL